MKRTEIAMILLVGGVSLLGTFFLIQSVLGEKVNRERAVPDVAPISTEEKKPSGLIFNSEAINPTVEVLIDDSVILDADPDSHGGEPSSSGQDSADNEAPKSDN